MAAPKKDAAEVAEMTALKAIARTVDILGELGRDHAKATITTKSRCSKREVMVKIGQNLIFCG